MNKWLKLAGKIGTLSKNKYTIHDTFLFRVQYYGAWLLSSQSKNLMLVKNISLSRQAWPITISEAASFKADKPIYNVYMSTICT